MSGSVIESSEREECGGNPITRKEPADKKLWGHVHRRGWGVRECEGYKTPKITVVDYFLLCVVCSSALPQITPVRADKFTKSKSSIHMLFVLIQHDHTIGRNLFVVDVHVSAA